MIEQVKQLLAEREFKLAAIVDDAFDEMPTATEIRAELWDRFFDDLQESDDNKLSEAYGKQKYDDSDVSDLRRDPIFVDAAWRIRADVPPAAALFGEFSDTQRAKRDRIAPLQHLLVQELGLSCKTFGREGHDDVDNADIIFLDLFLGYVEGEEAILQAIARIKGVIEKRRANPPTVVLLSESALLQELGPRVRDDAELLGCQFRMVSKNQLSDSELLAERLYELAVSYPDSLKLNSFMLSWDRALKESHEKFLRSIRTLDLPDYANMNALILEAEEEPVGDYILDLYDLHLHSILEGDIALITAGKALNEISWADYPPAQFMPSEEADQMMDGALFHNQSRTKTEAAIDNDPKAVRLGDVFVTSPVIIPADGATPARSEQHAYVVLSQACDLKHGGVDTVLLLKGSVQPYERPRLKSSTPRTPIMYVDDQKLSVDWNLLAVETWRIDDIPDKLAAGLERVRRLRTPFALQLQQAFIGRLGRVGTLAALPTRYRAGVRIILRKANNIAELLVEADVEANQAVCLVGRDGDNATREWLLLSDGLLLSFRRALKSVDANEFARTTPSLSVVRDDPAFYRKLKGGLVMRRDAPKGEKPFKGTAYDVIQIFGSRSIQIGSETDRSYHQIIIEVEFP
ncbi:hypothetical protein [Bradyrhizobium sp. dw_411]|uniref:hypothetical protein n=1 Tax=Bradyrhizobium sp. dw_411 TaxID=2720082 RepID=UPI001BCFEF6A|nr:hypothetical protein [Bradyrhizobium sp. dw_411]